MYVSPPEEERLKAYGRAPGFVRGALSDGPLFDFYDRLRTGFALHIDTVGAIIPLTRDLLLGFLPPAQFIEELVNLGMSRDVAKQIIDDLNENVFIPLREQIQTGTGPFDDFAPPQPIQKPLQAKPATVSETISTQIPLSTVQASPAESQIRTMAQDMASVQSGAVVPQYFVPGQPAAGAPHGWQAAASVHVFVPAGPPQQAMHPASPAPQAPVLPAAISPAPVEYNAPATYTAPAITTPAPPAPATLTKEYGSDPYREPV